MWYIACEENTDHIEHFGILGQKWGIRRYQYEDGSLTPEGRARYGTQENYDKALRKHDKRVRRAKAIAIGAAAGLAIYGGARYLSKQRALKKQLTAGLDDNYLNNILPNYKKTAKGFSYDQLKKVQENMLNDARDTNFLNPKKKAVYDVVTSEMKRRDDMAKAFTGEGKKAITDMLKNFGDNSRSTFSKGMGTAIGAAAVGALVATAKQVTEGKERTPEAKADEYANYMWQNPNKK